MNAILSIKPEYVDKIFNGEKQYEFRKILFKEEVEKVIIYSTYPKKKIVGEFIINDILTMQPDELWEKTKENSGISRTFFMEYFKNKNIAYAIHIKDVTKYDEEKDIVVEYGVKAPQSFLYVNNK